MPYVVPGARADSDASYPARVVLGHGTVMHCMKGGLGVVVGPLEPPLWQQVEEEGLFGAGSELPNLALGSLLEEWQEDDPHLAGCLVVLPGYDGYDAPLHLCTNSAGTCPATADDALVGARHTCDGLLGRHPGEELFWIECASLRFIDRRGTDAAATRASAESVLRTEVRERAGALLGAGLRGVLDRAMRSRAGDLIGDDPRGFARRIMEAAAVWRGAGQDLTIAEVLRIEVCEPLMASLEQDFQREIKRLLRSQLRQIQLDRGDLVAAVVAEVIYLEGTPCDPADAEEALRAAVAGRLAGEHADLLDEDVLAVERAAGGIDASLAHNLLAALEGDLADLVLRIVRETVVERTSAEADGPAPAA